MVQCDHQTPDRSLHPAPRLTAPIRFEWTRRPGTGPGLAILGQLVGATAIELGCGSGHNLATTSPTRRTTTGRAPEPLPGSPPCSSSPTRATAFSPVTLNASANGRFVKSARKACRSRPPANRTSRRSEGPAAARERPGRAEGGAIVMAPSLGSAELSSLDFIADLTTTRKPAQIFLKN
jgi:hypothetical protein